MSSSNAPIVRSAALQRALARPPARAASSAPTTSFADTLAHTQAAPRKTPAAAPARATAPNRSAPSVGSGPVPFADQISAAAKKYGVDPALLAALIKQESNFNPHAQSGVGAKGLTQLMDATARGLGVSDSFDPAQNLDGGAKFLGGLLKQFKGDPSLALAAYNAGPGAVKKYGGIPPFAETQRYVPRVLAYFEQYRRSGAFS